MKDFLKMTGATIVGLLLFSVITSILSIVMMVAILAASTPAAKTLTDGSVLKINVDGALVERSETEDMTALMSALDENYVAPLALEDVRAALNKAALSGKVEAVYLNCGILSASPASVEEFRAMLLDFKAKTGKPVYAYADNYSQSSYWLASVADSLFVNPQGLVSLQGIALQNMFFKSALDKLGVEMQIFKVGTFKSAVEPYIMTEMSDANRLQMTRLAEGIWEAIERDVCSARGIEPEVLNGFVNRGGFFGSAEELVELKIVDGVKYRDEMEKFIKAKVDKCKFVSLAEMVKAPVSEKYSGNKVAVLYATGGIDDGSQTGMVSEDIVKELNKLAKDDKIKAVVLRVNSPGGSAFGSEQMWHAAQVLREKKPLIVSMSDYAASGGYYMSCIADTIIAQPTTLTGSIGIFGMFPNAEGLMDKVGVDIDGVKSHQLADFGMITRPCTDSERTVMQAYINRGYETFVSRCADGRGMSTDSIKAIAEGRVWLGVDAVDLGLVDLLGGLQNAIDIASASAGLIDNYSVVAYPKKKDFMTLLLESIDETASVKAVKSALGEYANLYEHYQRVMGAQGVQALMPYYVEF